MSKALASGTVSGSADFGTIAESLSGQLTLDLTHDGGVYGGLASFQGTGSATDDNNASASWSGAASTGGSMQGTWDGDSLVFNLFINHNGVGQANVLTL